ncbi:response regulator [bacterium]|nr:response regulator [bacterium]
MKATGDISHMAEILLVQSSPTRAVEIRILLERIGHEVKHASSGKDAIHTLRGGAIHLVIADLNLKEMSGAEFVRVVQTHFPDVVVIFITPAGAEQHADDALRAGAVGCVSEEHLQVLLIETVETALRVTFGNDPYGALLSRLKSNTFEFELPNDPRLISPLVTLVVQVSQGMRLLSGAERTRLGVALEHALVNAMYRGNLGLGASVTPSQHQIVFGHATTDLIEKRKAEAPYKDRRTQVRVVAEVSGIKITVRDGGDGFNVEHFFDSATLARLKNESGHGLLLMERLTDDLQFNLEGNEVTLVKNARSH